MTDSYQTTRDEFFDDGTYVSRKKRLLALLLAFIFGPFGAHRFYVGKYGSAMAMILIDLTLIGFAVTGIWSLVDCLFILLGEFTDANGDKLIDWT